MKRSPLRRRVPPRPAQVRDVVPGSLPRLPASIWNLERPKHEVSLREAEDPKHGLRKAKERRSKRKGLSLANVAQREKVREQRCVVCLGSPCDPAHLIPRGVSTIGQDDPRAVVALCRRHHDEYDHARTLDLSVYWQSFPVELGFAVERFGPMALRRISNRRDAA